jgi:hypothetical protein
MRQPVIRRTVVVIEQGRSQSNLAASQCNIEALAFNIQVFAFNLPATFPNYLLSFIDTGTSPPKHTGK